MTRSSFRPIASVGLVVAVLIYVGCDKPVVTGDKAPAKITTRTTPTEKLPKLITDWLKNAPVGILMISAEQDGYPAPCGCTEGQLGGLGRRFHFCQMLEAQGWPVAKIDLGNLVDPQKARGGPRQEKIKFDVIHQALSAMKYDAVAIGPEDLRLGVLDTLGTLLNLNREPKFLAGNVKPADDGLAAAFRSTAFAKVGPVTIGITSVLDPGRYQDLHDTDSGLLIVRNPDEAIPALLAELKAKAEVAVLMVQGPHEEARRLAEKFPGFDIVVGTSLTADPDEHAETLNGGKTLLVDNIGKKGKYVGVVGFFPNSTPKVQYRRQPLDGRDFTEAKSIQQLLDVDYQKMLKDEGVVENFPRFAHDPKGATYLGAKACQSCHPKTFEKWTSTKHARAYEALQNPKRNREFDAECISCHTTGFGYTGGWVSLAKTPLLGGNQCENCHGPASLHAADPDNQKFRLPMRMTAESANKNNFCTKCHDEDNDHNFTFDARYSQIFHKALDDYTDPRVHQNQAVPAK